MSRRDDDTRDWRFYIEDMIEFAERALSYTKGMSQSEFLADNRTYDATLRNVELVGEAARHIPASVREAHPHINWRGIIGTRDHVAHGYLGLDDDIIWDVIQSDLPELISELRSLLKSERER